MRKHPTINLVIGKLQFSYWFLFKLVNYLPNNSQDGYLKTNFFHGIFKYLEPKQGLIGTYYLIVRSELAKLRKQWKPDLKSLRI
jgi:hypothetical protein